MEHPYLHIMIRLIYFKYFIAEAEDILEVGFYSILRSIVPINCDSREQNFKTVTLALERTLNSLTSHAYLTTRPVEH